MEIKDLFEQIWNMSITASFVIAAVLLVRGLIRSFPKKYSFLLWLVVGIRLVCPFAVSSPFSLFNLGQTRPEAMGDVQGDSNAERNTQQNIAVTVQNNVQIPRNKEQKEASPILPAAENEKDRSLKTDLLSVMAVIWLCGMAGLLLWNLYLVIRTRRKLWNAVLFQPPEPAAGLGSDDKTPLINCWNIYECDNLASPFVIGLFKPKIYIPFRLQPEEQVYIIRHEQYHIRRKDYITKFLAFLIMTVHWFNPLAWAAYLCMECDMEMSCDEQVLSEMGETIKTDYSQSLLAFASNQRRFSIGISAFGESNTRKRVKNIMKFKKKGKWMGLAGAAVLLAVSTVCLTNAKAAEVQEDSPKPASGQTEAVDDNESAIAVDKDLNAEEIYDGFLSGKIEAIDKDGYRRSIIDYEDVQEYAVYDMNGDAVPELMIRSRISLDIFWIYNNELTLWYTGAAYARPLNNMAILYERAGGSPKHTDYMYTVLGYQGEELYKVDFSEYSATEFQGVEYGSRYFVDDAEVTKEAYDSLAEQFLNIGDDKIEWKTFMN